MRIRIVKPDAVDFLATGAEKKFEQVYLKSDIIKVDIDTEVNNWRCCTTWINNIPLKSFSEYLKEKIQ